MQPPIAYSGDDDQHSGISRFLHRHQPGIMIGMIPES
jgi:hypothetical protein